MALGELLRDARMRKGLTIAQVAEATRMMVQVVEELEREDFRRIAAPIYGRGFIKLYAEHVGLDPEPLIQEFVEIYTGARAPLVARRAVAAEPAAPAAAVAPAAAETRSEEQRMKDQPLAAQADDRPAPVAATPAAPAAAPVAEPSQPVAEDDLFAAASRRPAPERRPTAEGGSPPRVSPVGVRAIRRPTPALPAMPAAAPACTPAEERPAGASVSVVAGLRRLWGSCSVPAGWITRRRLLLAAAAAVVIAVVAYGLHALMQATARSATQGGPPVSVQVLPPPDPYVD